MSGSYRNATDHVSSSSQRQPHARQWSHGRQPAGSSPTPAARPSQTNDDPSEPHQDSDPYDPQSQYSMSYGPLASSNNSTRRPHDPSAALHTPPRHYPDYPNLRHQFAVDDTEVEDDQHNRRPEYDGGPSEQTAQPQRAPGTAGPPVTYPPVSYYRATTHDPEQQRYSQASTAQEMSTKSSSEWQKPSRAASQKAARTPDLRRLSTNSTPGVTSGQPNQGVSEMDTIRPSGNTASQGPPAATDPDDQPITIEVFRALLGIPQKGSAPMPLDSARRAAAGDDPITPKTPYSGLSNSRIIPQALDPSQDSTPRRTWRQYIFNVLTIGRRREAKKGELSTSIYFSILREEKITRRLYYLYDILTYSCMLAQLVISAVLIILGARSTTHHVVISILGAVGAILVGLLSLIKGQGFPTRLVQYLDSLRRVKEDIEFTERELRAQRRIVTYGEVVALKNSYDSVREDQVKNSPDIWNAGVGSPAGKSAVLTSAQQKPRQSTSRTAEGMV
jgi:hypothetical protein